MGKTNSSFLFSLAGVAKEKTENFLLICHFVKVVLSLPCDSLASACLASQIFLLTF